MLNINIHLNGCIYLSFFFYNKGLLKELKHLEENKLIVRRVMKNLSPWNINYPNTCIHDSSYVSNDLMGKKSQKEN